MISGIRLMSPALGYPNERKEVKMAGKYDRTVKAALSETASKFTLAEAVARDIPEIGSGNRNYRIMQKNPDLPSLTDDLNAARDSIIAAGGEPRSVSRLGAYRLTALWVKSPGSRSSTFRWISGASFDAHSTAQDQHLTYEQFAAMPVKTAPEVVKLARRLRGEDDEPEPDDKPEDRKRRNDPDPPDPDPEDRKRKQRRPPPAPYGIRTLIHSAGADLKSAEGVLAEKGIGAFDWCDTGRTESLEELLDELDRSLARQADRIPRLRQVINEIRTDKVGLRRYAKEKAEAERKVAS